VLAQVDLGQEMSAIAEVEEAVGFPDSALPYFSTPQWSESGGLVATLRARPCDHDLHAPGIGAAKMGSSPS